MNRRVIDIHFATSSSELSFVLCDASHELGELFLALVLADSDALRADADGVLPGLSTAEGESLSVASDCSRLLGALRWLH